MQALSWILPSTRHPLYRYLEQRKHCLGMLVLSSWCLVLVCRLRALKTKHDTPKYGLIYHASLVGQSGPKMKGKISRMLAAKTSLAARVDALGEEVKPSIGIEGRAKVEARLRECEQMRLHRISGTGKGTPKTAKYETARWALLPTQWVTVVQHSQTVQSGKRLCIPRKEAQERARGWSIS